MGNESSLLFLQEQIQHLMIRRGPAAPKLDDHLPYFPTDLTVTFSALPVVLAQYSLAELLPGIPGAYKLQAPLDTR